MYPLSLYSYSLLDGLVFLLLHVKAFAEAFHTTSGVEDALCTREERMTL